MAAEPGLLIEQSDAYIYTEVNQTLYIIKFMSKLYTIVIIVYNIDTN